MGVGWLSREIQETCRIDSSQHPSDTDLKGPSLSMNCLCSCLQEKHVVLLSSLFRWSLCSCFISPGSKLPLALFWIISRGLLLSNRWNLKLLFGNSDSILCHLCILPTFTTKELEIVIQYKQYFAGISSFPFSPLLL